jgi:ribosomal protein S18 acetylase RimI-like enzyme
VGFAVIQFFDRHAHLNLLAVAPGYRRRGIGRALLEWLESSARTAGTFVLRLELRAGNEAAREFYRRHGFQDAGVSTDYYAGREDALRMVRDLAVAVT